MKRIICVLALVLPVLFAAGAAAEEVLPPAEPDPGLATPTDLCPHEKVRKTFYFDAPDYRPLNAESHLVAGRAVVEEACEECGQILRTAVEDMAEEVYAHTLRDGKCVLCGWEENAGADDADPKEVLWVLTAEESLPNRYFFTLTGRDLASAGNLLVLRPSGCDVALALRTAKIRAQISSSGGTFTAEIGKPDERKVSTSVRMYDAEGEETQPDRQAIVLRIFGEGNGDPLTVSYTNSAGKTRQQEAQWTSSGENKGYWDVAWQGNGVYSY